MTAEASSAILDLLRMQSHLSCSGGYAARTRSYNKCRAPVRNVRVKLDLAIVYLAILSSGTGHQRKVLRSRLMPSRKFDAQKSSNLKSSSGMHNRSVALPEEKLPWGSQKGKMEARTAKMDVIQKKRHRTLRKSFVSSSIFAVPTAASPLAAGLRRRARSEAAQSLPRCRGRELRPDRPQSRDG